MLISSLESDPFYFVSVVVTVVTSIVVHELAHGVAAIWQGDDTPIRLGHMTPNPIVHMGWFSLLLLCTIGIAYGQMPVNPARFRSRRGESLVALAGPLSNVLLALLAMTALGLWIRFGADASTPFQVNAREFLWCFGYINVALALFNMIPIPPLDGSVILADFYPPFSRYTCNPRYQGTFLFCLFAGIMLLERAGGGLFGLANHVGLFYLSWVRGF